MTKITTRQGLIALSPIFVLIGLFLTLSIAWGNFDKVPLVVVFVIAS
ncbi:MAG: Na+/H+ antiporter NhaC family protein, partial [Alloprevotella sp.]